MDGSEDRSSPPPSDSDNGCIQSENLGEGQGHSQSENLGEGQGHSQSEDPGEGQGHSQSEDPGEGQGHTQSEDPGEGQGHSQSEDPGEGQGHTQTAKDFEEGHTLGDQKKAKLDNEATEGVSSTSEPTEVSQQHNDEKSVHFSDDTNSTIESDLRKLVDGNAVPVRRVEVGEDRLGLE